MMTRATTHEEVDHPFGLGCEVRSSRLAYGAGEQVRAKHVGQGSGAKAKRSTAEQLPTRYHEFGFSERINVIHGTSKSWILKKHQSQVAG